MDSLALENMVTITLTILVVFGLLALLVTCGPKPPPPPPPTPRSSPQNPKGKKSKDSSFTSRLTLSRDHKVRKRRHARSRFIHRPSLLDSGMDVVVPWRQPINPSDLRKSVKKFVCVSLQQRKYTPLSLSLSYPQVFRGWYNLFWLSGVSFALAHFFSNYKTTQYVLFNPRYFFSLGDYLHESLGVLLPLYFISFSAYGIQKLISFQIFGVKYSRPILQFFQHIIQTFVIFGTGFFVYFYCEHWPFTQKMALFSEAIVLYMVSM